MVLGRVAPADCSKRSATARSSASCAVAYALSGTEESVMLTRSTHIPSASDVQSPRRFGGGREYTVVRDACLSATAPASAATPPLPGLSRQAHRAHLVRAPHSPLAVSQAVYAPPGADSDSSAPKLDASAAKKTSAVSLLRCVRPARPT